MVVLNEFKLLANRLVKCALVEALEKETTRIAEYFRLDDQHLWNGGFDHIHERTSSASRWFRYLP
ncbi:Uncharacterised protein [Mycobacterium tuberculosis]|nr:Uncharacterised protein [Mycobacterium tuberculosis]